MLEHVREPAALLREVATRVRRGGDGGAARGQLSARREGKREHADEVGHLQRLDRSSARAIVGQAGLRVAGELRTRCRWRHSASSPTDASAEAGGGGKWGTRSALHLLAPPLARRLFTVHYACLCLPR